MVEPTPAGLLAGIAGGLGGLKKNQPSPALGASGQQDKKKTCSECQVAFRGFGPTCASCRAASRPTPAVEGGEAKDVARVVEFLPTHDDFRGVVSELYVDPMLRDKVRVGLHDARLEPKDLLTHGFELMEHPIAATFSRDNFGSEDRIGCYHEDLTAFVRDKLSAKLVICISHKVRLSSEVDFANGKSGYIGNIHADISPQLGRDIVQKSTVEERGLPPPDGRCQLMNAWRNISDTPISNHTLATCDATSVSFEDIGIFGSPTLANTAHHRWCYHPRMTKDEVLLFMHWDSAWSRHRPTVHAAFADPTAPADAPNRESIESRLLVIY